MTTARRAPNKHKLSELAVKRLRPRATPYLVWDTTVSGLVLRIRPTGVRSWYCVYSRHGRPRWYRLGDVNIIPLGDARLLAREALLAVARGGDPAADKRAARGRGTFAELATQYVEQHAKRHNKSWQQAAALVRRHLIPRWGKLQADKITRGDVKAVVRSIKAPIVANQTLAAASAIFAWAIREEIVKGNPCKLVERNKTNSRERVLADGEIPKFWCAFDSVGLVAGSALKTLLLTGQRPGEVCHMRREHVADGWWTMPGDPLPDLKWPGTKNGRTHRIWLPTSVQKLLSELGDDETQAGLVFARVSSLDQVMRKICKKIGAERTTPHDLRRTHGTTITGLGLGREAMNRVQNHVEGGIGDVYDRHDYSAEIKRTMEAAAAHITALAEGEPAAQNVVRFGKQQNP
jgi:integrase